MSVTTEIVSAVIAAISATIAVFAFYLPRKDQRDQQLHQQAILSLERAYRSLTNDGKQVAPPAPDRLNWLTSARHILGYKALKAQLKTDLYKLLCNEHEEFWRHQFYLSLDTHKIHDPGYYDKWPSLRPEIEPRSAIIIHGFTVWPSSKVDPIDLADIKSLLQEPHLLAGNHGLREYLVKFPRVMGDE